MTKMQAMIEFSGGGAALCYAGRHFHRYLKCLEAPIEFSAPVRVFSKFMWLGLFVPHLGNLFSQARSLTRYRFENKSPKNFFAKKQSKYEKHSPLTVHSSQINETDFSRFTSHFSLPQPPAFTLAEVLITLGIIGIVAAMTLPSIMARHRSKVLEAQFHKRISEVSQAIMMLKKDEYFSGTLIGEQIASLLASQFKGSIVPDRSIYSAQKQYQKTQIGYELPTYKNYTKTADFRKYKLDDGAIIVSKEFFIFINNDNYSLTNYQIIIDVNGLQKPNIFGYDVFAFELDKTDTLKSMPYSNATKAYCNTTSSDESNGWSCSYYAMTERDYFKNLNW